MRRKGVCAYLVGEPARLVVAGDTVAVPRDDGHAGGLFVSWCMVYAVELLVGEAWCSAKKKEATHANAHTETETHAQRHRQTDTRRHTQR